MKKTSTLLMALMLMVLSIGTVSLTSCKPCKDIVHEVHIRDTIKELDTVYRYIKVADSSLAFDIANMATEELQEALDLYAMSNDSMRAELLQKDQRIKQLLWQLSTNRFSTDTVHASTAYADAWACILNNQIKLWLKQKQIDTNLAVVNTNTTINNTDQVSEQAGEKDTASKVLGKIIGIVIALAVLIAAIAGLIIVLRRHH